MPSQRYVVNSRSFRYGHPQVFLTEDGYYRVLTIIQVKKKRFVRCLKRDAVEAIYQKPYEELIHLNPKNSGDPAIISFIWPYSRYKDRIEREWAWLGELG